LVWALFACGNNVENPPIIATGLRHVNLKMGQNPIRKLLSGEDFGGLARGIHPESAAT